MAKEPVISIKQAVEFYLLSPLHEIKMFGLTHAVAARHLHVFNHCVTNFVLRTHRIHGGGCGIRRTEVVTAFLFA